jgi:hypothetical protein
MLKHIMNSRKPLGIHTHLAGYAIGIAFVVLYAMPSISLASSYIDIGLRVKESGQPSPTAIAIIDVAGGGGSPGGTLIVGGCGQDYWDDGIHYMDCSSTNLGFETKGVGVAGFNGFAAKSCGGVSSYTVTTAYTNTTGGLFQCSQPTIYDFGGIYSSSASCPSGYTAHPFKVDDSGFTSTLYFCERSGSVSGGTEYEFGGVYITKNILGGAEILHKANPETGAASCPSGYTASAGFGTSNASWSPSFHLYYCYKDVSAVTDAQRSQIDFGGMFGTYTCIVESTNQADINGGCPDVTSRSPAIKASNNSATGAQTCPLGYNKQVLLPENSSGPLNGSMERNSHNWTLGYCSTASSNTETSGLRIAKNGTIYQIAVVDITDPSATKIRFKMANGSVKALRKY